MAGRAVNLSCQLGGSAERMRIKCAVGHDTTKQFIVCVMETVGGANKKIFLDLVRSFQLHRRYLQIFLSMLNFL